MATLTTPRSILLEPAHVGLNSAGIDAIQAGLKAITETAQASLSLVPDLVAMPVWYGPVHSAIAHTQARAHGWLTQMCPSICVALPREIGCYARTFATQSAQLQRLLLAIGNGPPSATQLMDAQTAFQALYDSAANVAAKATDLHDYLVAYTAILSKDVDALAQAQATLEQNLRDGQTHVQRLQDAFGTQPVVAGHARAICDAMVSLDMDRAAKAAATGAPPEAVSIVVCNILGNALLVDTRNALPPLEDWRDSWGMAQAEIAAVLQQLDDAQNDLGAVLTGFDLNNARRHWTELGTYAGHFVPH